MLKGILKKRCLLLVAVFFGLFLINIVSKDNIYTLDKVSEKVEYVNEEVNVEKIYLLDQNNMLAMTEVGVNDKEIETKARKLINILIDKGEGENLIPSGFKSLIPNDTKINSFSYENNLIKIDFSDSLLDVDKQIEEKIVEAIVYTLTSIDGVDKVIIYIDGNILTKLPKSGINLPSTLDKRYGINKEYDLETYKDVNSVTVYYINKHNDTTYYVPVTKYVNDDRDKINIIVEELASNLVSNTNLMSYLNSNAKLISSQKETDSLFLVFNEYIFNDMSTKNILEEVIYTISLSADANYDIKEVIFKVENEEIYKKSV